MPEVDPRAEGLRHRSPARETGSGTPESSDAASRGRIREPKVHGADARHVRPAPARRSGRIRRAGDGSASRRSAAPKSGTSKRLRHVRIPDFGVPGVDLQAGSRRHRSPARQSGFGTSESRISACRGWIYEPEVGGTEVRHVKAASARQYGRIRRAGLRSGCIEIHRRQNRGLQNHPADEGGSRYAPSGLLDQHVVRRRVLRMGRSRYAPARLLDQHVVRRRVLRVGGSRYAPSGLLDQHGGPRRAAARPAGRRSTRGAHADRVARGVGVSRSTRVRT
ncbi:hypothetical protein EDF35_1014 [Rathayibacter sp. PhB151]|nr:hypothetical protein EDF35_1014 [Rathayibacter sp. PhB151]